LSQKTHLVTFMVKHDDHMSDEFIERRVRQVLDDSVLDNYLITVNPADERDLIRPTQPEEHCPACNSVMN
jgi:hypothetical protein